MASSAASHQEPYTKYPNMYTDIHKPKLTSVQRDVCDVVIRLTYGWHKTSAPISISTFTKKTGRSRRAIISAKQQLLGSGLLVELEHGGGTITSEYVLDLYYNTDKSIQHEQLTIEDVVQQSHDELSIQAYDDSPISDATNNVCVVADVHTEPTIDHSDVSPTTTDVSTSEPNVDIVTDAPDDEDSMAPQTTSTILDTTTPQCDNSDTNTHSDDEYNSDVDTPTITPEVHSVTSDKSDSTMHLEPGTIEVQDTQGGANNALPPNKDLRSIISIKKTNSSSATSNVASEVGGGTNTIRCLFYKLFPTDSDRNDWSYFGYLITTYGMEACTDKINYMAEHRKLHTLTNPKGFLRRALEHNYQIPKSIILKLRAEESAKLAGECTRSKSQEWRATVSNFDYGNASVALAKLMESLN